jgi:hypothetical protein
MNKNDILVGQLKSTIKSCLGKFEEKYCGKETMLFAFIKDNSIFYKIQTKTLNDKWHVQTVNNLSELMSRLKYIAIKNMGFDVDMDTVDLVDKLYEKYSKLNGIDRSLFNFFFYKNKDNVSFFFNPIKHTGIKPCKVEFVELFEEKSNEK